MKNFTQARILSLSLCLLFVAMLFVSSCTSPQHFSFTAAPPTYHKVKKEQAEPQTEITEEPATLTASTETEAIVLPEIANLTTKKALALATPAKVEKKENTAQPKQKLTLAQKVVLKKLQKQANKLQNADQSEKATQAAGPVSSKSAIALILIGLIIAIFGLILQPLYAIGVLVLLIGLVLLILTYL